MKIPRYTFTNDFLELYDYFCSQPHQKMNFRKGEYLWKPDEPITRVYYIRSGIVETMVEHENGYQKLFHFHGPGSIFPGCHETQFKIERSILTKAITPVETLTFPREQFYRMFQENKRLNEIQFETYAAYINLLLYEAAHQEYNNSLIKLCNLLYLFAVHSSPRIDLTQENIAEILTINRVNVAKVLSRLKAEGIIASHRRWIEIIDLPALEEYCSLETLQEE